MNRFQLPSAVAAATMLIGLCGCGAKTDSASGYVPKKQGEMKSATVAPGQEASYFPFAKGNQWTFATETSQIINGRATNPVKGLVTYRMVDVKPGPGGSSEATCEILKDDVVMDRQIWRMEKTGLSEVALGKELSRFSTPQMVVPFPPKAGQTFTWKGTIKAETGEIRNATNTGTVLGEELVDTEMGRPYKALAIESKGTLTSAANKSNIASKIWLIPDVGIGRYRQEAVGEQKLTDPKMKGRKVPFAIVQLMKLKNYSIKK